MSTVADASVLIYGRDAILLETRSQVLKQGGFRVATITRLEDFHDLNASELRVFVLCHTLSEIEQREAIETGEKANQDLRTVVLTYHSPGSSLGARCRFMSPFAGPEALKALVREAVWRTAAEYQSMGNDASFETSTVTEWKLRSRSGWMYLNPRLDETGKLTFSSKPEMQNVAISFQKTD
jgi:hypothetical protein